MSGAPRMAVLGGGVTGLTTALVLELGGLSTRIYTRERPDLLIGRLAPGERPSRLASLHAAASILPHSIEDPRSLALTATSLLFFDLLAARPGTGVRRQTHYEVFEAPAPEAPYLAVLARVEPLQAGSPAARAAPRRPGVRDIYGWRLDACFCDAPLYLAKLAQLYLRAGGSFVERRLDRAGLGRLPADLVVDCTGAGSAELFDDPAPARLLRGRWLRVSAPPAAGRGGAISYNYTPRWRHYPAGVRAPAGPALGADVYAYPRADGWILGGTREAGRRDAAGGWVGEEPRGELRRVDGLEVPAPILELNAELVAGLGGPDLRSRPLAAGCGDRFTRAGARGLRLELGEERRGMAVVHNTGHGGAGFTLSWGSAVETAVIAAARLGRPLRPGSAARGGLLGALSRPLSAALAGEGAGAGRSR